MITPTPTTTGETSAETKSQTQQRIDAALRVVAEWGVGWSRSKVLRLVRRYERDVERNGFTLFDYLLNTAALTEQQRRQAYRRVADPDNLVLLSYSDITGETACRNVMHDQGLP